MNASYYVHRSEGHLLYDPGLGTKYFQPWWCIVICDQGIVDFYAWLLKRHGTPIMKGSSSGPHISFIKGIPPTHSKDKWGYNPGPITFYYSNIIRTDNDRHAWLDCWSDQLIELRAELGVPPKPNMSYHLTLGRLL